MIIDLSQWHLEDVDGLEDPYPNVHEMRRFCGKCGVRPQFAMTPEDLRRCVVCGEPYHIQVRRWRPEARGA